MKSKIVVFIYILIAGFSQTLNAENKLSCSNINLKTDSYSIKTVDFKFINSIPKIVLKYSKEAKATGSDSTPDISNKRNLYFNKLIEIEKDLINKNYFHDEIQLTQLNAISTMAELKANLRYPLVASAGCSMHDYYVDTEQIIIIRDLIYFTVKEIYKASKECNISGEKPISFNKWVKEWKNSGLNQ